MASQQNIPIKMGRPPFLIKRIRLVLRPIAAIAMMMKNLDKSLSGTNAASSTPAPVAIVVIRLARMKKRMKVGKACLIETFVPVSLRLFRKASPSVIGMMANVRVNLTMTALSRVCVPKW